MSARRVTVRVPATTANMGPGFDCLGMALDLWNVVDLEVSVRPGVRVIGMENPRVTRTARRLVFRAVERLYRELGEPAPTLRLTCRNAIPPARGLGASATAVVGGVLGANELCGQPLPQQRLLELAAEVEGHPDNVAPALLGGCQLVVRDSSRVLSTTVALPEGMHAVLFVPVRPMSTREARAVLPGEVPRGDAVHNIGRAALLVHALERGELGLLRLATSDRLHQPQRQGIFPAMQPTIQAALDAGALAAFLSGGGSTICALTCSGEQAVGTAMQRAAGRLDVRGEVMVSRPTRQGAHLAGA